MRGGEGRKRERERGEREIRKGELRERRVEGKGGSGEEALTALACMCSLSDCCSPVQ